MVVTDLHGDWNLYRKYRDHFLSLRMKGEVDYLIFTGDLIHNEGPPEMDKSLLIILDILKLREELGDSLIYLLGNHELPHLYSITLQKGNIVYTPRFEAEMGEHRQQIINLFHKLPFFVRTKAGVSITHAGGARAFQSPTDFKKLSVFSHQDLWEKAGTLLPMEERPSLRTRFARLNRAPYDEMARELLAVNGPDDPRYDNLLVGAMFHVFPEFDMLWETFFNKNEYEYGEHRYAQILDATLNTFLQEFFPQTMLVSGHIVCPHGYQIIAGKQLRLASGIHAKPVESARYLIFDTERPSKNIEELVRFTATIAR